ncbi:quinone oxidoreductase family protein [Luteipulveratus flavus]|uniref:Zinc-binding dehydrogenase n=1 Tax=Luteipulveratus flavus TaxID=3031728 RepID=A0ABT6C5X2_9MICO|nr:zinc-binding dehydrogenase [Luteipulveratus sp. YIM 133296]MDF8262676.1 zinc-binding dehydrogenase [Luteipulveratus sp. YIM 133296]
MRAVGIERYGSADELRMLTVPEPIPRGEQELIDVTMAGINFADVSRRRGTYDVTTDLPVVLGAEVVGTSRTDGRRVAALTGGFGGYAQVAAADTALTFDVPDGVSDEAAAATLLQGLTALFVTRVVGELRAGQTVAIHAAAGGVGSLAVQLAVGSDARRVVGVASTSAKRELARQLGAHATVDADPHELSDRLIDANDGAGYDLIVEMVGGRTFEESVRALAPAGRLVSFGRASGEAPALEEADGRVVDFSLLDMLRSDPRRLQAPAAELFAAVAEGELTPTIGGIYDASAAADAHRAIEERRTTGKLLLRIPR